MDVKLVMAESGGTPQDIKAVQEGLGAYNRAKVGPENYAPLHLFLRDEQGCTLGGLLGVFYWGWCSIEYLWVSEELRGQGYGTTLLETAENEARQRGIKNINLDTMSFQAPAFYQAKGYEVFGQLDDVPAGSGQSRYFLKKKL